MIHGENLINKERISPLGSAPNMTIVTLSGFLLVILGFVAGYPGKGNKIHIEFDTTYDVEKLENETCAHQMARVYRDDVTTPYPPELSGEWTSLRCEIRPGPEFILRKYRFFEGSRFVLYQFYYEDSYCKHPAFVVIARGSYKVFQPSWLLPGTTDMEYELNHVAVMPYSNKMAAILARKVNSSCPGYAGHGWKKGHMYDIFNYVEALSSKDAEDADLLADVDCLSALNLSVHELQLLRLEVRRKHHQTEQLLFLGDIHTHTDQRRTYRPTAFQDPLTSSEKVHACPVCLAIRDSDEFEPPSIHHQHTAALDLTGSWFSQRCETRPNGIFLTRHLSFSDNNRTWEGYYHHFLDGACERPQFTIYVKGKLAHSSKSETIAGAFEVDFQLLQARIKPSDMNIVALLNGQRGNKRCGTRTWQINREDDVTETSGCYVLGIRIPQIEHEMLKVEKHHRNLKLYLGQKPTEGDTVHNKRPTSFQSPLVRCSDSVNVVTPPYEFHAYSTGGSTVASLPQLWCVLCSFFFSVLSVRFYSRLSATP